MHTRTYPTSLDRVLTLNRVFDEALNSTVRKANRMWVPALDVVERPDGYTIHAELPGVSPDQVELSFEQNVLTIRGTKQPAITTQSEGEVRVFAAERVVGSFERNVRLPEHVDAEHIDASFAHGLLTVSIPKAKTAQPRKIDIRS